MALKGIDVSKYQGNIDWDKAKSSIDFAILRCGYGSDIVKQDDSKFERNVAECERLGIPFAVYLYSYATTAMNITSEVCHVLRTIGNHKPFCIYIDMEDASTTKLGKATLTSFAHKFCKAIEAQGYKAGVYANQNWFQNYLDVADLYSAGYSIWCAKYSDNKPNINAPYDIWQYSSKGKVNGITGNVDMNYMYNDIRCINVAPIKPEVVRLSTSALADEIIAGKWGNDDARIANLKKAGYTDAEIKSAQDEVNKRYAKPVKKSASELADEILAGKYGNGDDRIKNLKNLGYNDAEIKAAQDEVNKRCKKSSKLSTKDLAKAILRGDFGNGSARTKKLKSLGYTDAEIKAAQSLVNKGEVK